jgi:hypothetical protein
LEDQKPIFLKIHLKLVKILEKIFTFDQEKVRTRIGKELDNDKLAEMGISYMCVKGKKADEINQDDFFIIIDTGYILLGVFDGHGNYGHELSSFV